MADKRKIVKIINLVIKKLVKPKSQDVKFANLDKWRVNCHAKLMIIMLNLNVRVELKTKKMDLKTA